jgi:hypothetical protein
MRPVELVYEALDRAGCAPKGDPHGTRYIPARCPAHEDSNASLQLSEGDEGTALIKCFAGCTTEEVVNALRLEWADLFPPKAEERRVPQVPAREVCSYVYTDEDGQPLIKVVRYEPKSFRQMRWEDGRWQWGLGETRRVLYRLPEVLAALARGEIVFIVEGEKDADRLRAEGKTATCPLGGAGKWRPEYTESLTGASNVIVVIGDDDEPHPKTGRREGHLHALDVWRALQGKVGRVIARLPAEGFKDVHDQLTAGVPFTSKTLRPIPALAEAPSAEQGSALMLTARAMSARPAPARSLQVVGPLMQRGMRTTIGAQTGEGKTTLALQAIRALVFREPFLDEAWTPPAPGKALIVDLEQGEETVKTRLREAGLADTDRVDVLWQPAGLALDSDQADQALLYEALKSGGYDLVLIDPLYQMHRGNPNDERTAADLMRLLDGWAREFNFALVIPMHARKPHPQAGKQFTIHDIAGAGTWNRNAEFVIGLQLMSTGSSRIHFFKDRIGGAGAPAVGSHWWLSFDREKGFARTHKEDRDSLHRTLNAMLERDAGVTEDELVAAGADQLWLKGMKKRAHVNPAGRWRKTDWNEQTALET